jgi:hypothetical protein
VWCPLARRSLVAFAVGNATNNPQTPLTTIISQSNAPHSLNLFETLNRSLLQLHIWISPLIGLWIGCYPTHTRILNHALPPNMSSMHLSQLRKWMLESPPVEWAINQLRELLIGALRQGPIPQHVAFVMDGNRRFARSHKIETVEGHNLGFEALARVCITIHV